MATESSETSGTPPAASAKAVVRSRLKRGLAIAFAILLFAFPLARHLYGKGNDVGTILFLVVPAVVLFLVIAPNKFGLGEKSRFDLTVRSDERPPPEGSVGESKWRP